jgi:outer membrane protein OmpA-like peptidoglycan-associated protein
MSQITCSVSGWALLAAILSPMAGLGQARTPAPTLVVASVESRWEDVYCDVTQLTRTAPSELTVRFQYRNMLKQAFKLPNAEMVPNTRVFDPAGRVLYGVLKDASGAPIASTMRVGALSRPVPAGGAQAHWARLEAPADSVSSVTVLVEGCMPFNGVTIGAGASATPLAKPAAAIASQDGEDPGLAVEVTRMARTAGGFMDVTVRYRNNGSEAFKFPSAGNPLTRRFVGTYVLDPASRKKYEVARDKEQEPLASESLQIGAGNSGEPIAAGTAVNLWAMFPAPPEATKAVSLVVALAPPFDNVPISGSGSGSAGGGSAVAGAVVGVDAALKDLGAKVTDTEIRIDLAADVLFDFDKATIKKEAEPSLQKVATVLKANPTTKVTIEGHTDGKGTDAYNQPLSEQRAAAVKQWLVANAQVNGATITTRGWGKTKPVAHNTKPDGSDDPDGRAKNRRVEIVVRKGG